MIPVALTLPLISCFSQMWWGHTDKRLADGPDSARGVGGMGASWLLSGLLPSFPPGTWVLLTCVSGTAPCRVKSIFLRKQLRAWLLSGSGFQQMSDTMTSSLPLRERICIHSCYSHFPTLNTSLSEAEQLQETNIAALSPIRKLGFREVDYFNASHTAKRVSYESNTFCSLMPRASPQMGGSWGTSPDREFKALLPAPVPSATLLPKCFLLE